MNDHPPPPDTPVQPSSRALRPAEPSDVKDAMAFALRYRGRKRTDIAGEVMAQITAEHLFEHLERSGFVVMHRVPAKPGPDMHYAPSVEKALRERKSRED